MLLLKDLLEIQEGDPRYLAPEVLRGSDFITPAADIFSLGITILELATDLELPNSGEGWHLLRNGIIPSDLKNLFSNDLKIIIEKMIEPDYLKRANVNDLLNMKPIKFLMPYRDKKTTKSKIEFCRITLFSKIEKFKEIFQYTLLYFIQFRDVLLSFSKIQDYFPHFLKEYVSNLRELLHIKNKDVPNTSTPKRQENLKSITYNIDDDQNKISLSCLDYDEKSPVKRYSCFQFVESQFLIF